MTQYDHIIIGGGAMGSAAAWQLALRGREVLLLERFTQVHVHGASHGASRNFNIAYIEDDYLQLVRESGTLWQELESETGERLLDLVGLVNHGGGQPEGHDVLLRDHGFRASALTPDEAQERWPGITFDTRVVYTPDGGRLNPDRAIPALQRVASAHGAEIRHETPVDAVRVRGRGVEVAAAGGTFTADSIVVTVGAWSRSLLEGLVDLPPLVVTQEQPAHFALADGGDGSDETAQLRWPGFNHRRALDDPRYGWWYSNVYGMLTPGQGVKAGWHGVGPVVDPDRRSYQPEPHQFEALRRYAREWLPGVDPDQFEAISCTYTTTPDEDFIVDRRGPIVVGAGFSGHGFKFTTAIGRLLADLATDANAPTLPRFGLGRFGL